MVRVPFHAQVAQSFNMCVSGRVIALVEPKENKVESEENPQSSFHH